MTGRLFLSGGGNEIKSHDFDKIYVDGIDGINILYIPIALNRDSKGFEACNLWINKALGQHTNRKLNIRMVLDLNEISEEELLKFNTVYIGGGNTYKLLDQVRQSHFDQYLLKYLNNGGLVYGGSAGAIIMGADISTVEEEKDREIDSNGLNLLGGYSIRCHIKEDDLDIVRLFIKRSGGKVLALPEGSGVIFQNDQFTVAGSNIYVVTAEGTKIVEVGMKF